MNSKIVLNKIVEIPEDCPFCQRRTKKCWFTGEICEYFGDNFKNCPVCVEPPRHIDPRDIKLR